MGMHERLDDLPGRQDPELGRILDGNGNPVEGVAIRMTGAQTRLAITDSQGNYRFDNVAVNGFSMLNLPIVPLCFPAFVSGATCNVSQTSEAGH